MRKVLPHSLILILVLSACSSQHLALVHEPYYPLAPDSALQSEHVVEATRLERKQQSPGESLSASESLRLLQLQQSELKHLKTSAVRYQQIKEQTPILEGASQELRQEVESLRSDVSGAARDARKEQKGPPPFEDSAVRSRYFEIARLWNQDENETAFEKCVAAQKDEALRDKLSDEQWARFINLRFRIALDRGDWANAGKAYQELHDLEDCSETSSEAGFLLSLHHFLEGQNAQAYQILEGQCDPDRSVYGVTRRQYWLARFLESSDPARAREMLIPIAANKLPSYYSILANQRLGTRMEAPARGAQKQYMALPLEVPSRVDELFTQSEKWLSSKLRRESQLALRRATYILSEDDSENGTRALLYAAHLHQASGSPLDAMRIYSQVVERLTKEPEWLNQVGYEFIDEMFPRPHLELVEAFTRHWGVDKDFAYAIIRQESAFNPSAVSPANARGWMQLMPFLAEHIAGEWGFSQFYQPDYLFYAPENLKLASYHLHKLSKILPHPALIAASYNAGVKRVAKWWKQRYQAPADVFVELIPINETRNYVKLVTRNYYAYKLLQLPPGASLDPAIVPMTLPPLVTTL